MKVCHAIEFAKTIEEVVEAVNRSDNSDALAAQYAVHCIDDSDHDYADCGECCEAACDYHLDILRQAGAEFDQLAATELLRDQYINAGKLCDGHSSC